jgi:hypothetical protein
MYVNTGRDVMLWSLVPTTTTDDAYQVFKLHEHENVEEKLTHFTLRLYRVGPRHVQ